MVDIDANTLLQYAVEHGIINLVSIKGEAEMSKKDDIIKNHPYSIWQGKDGKWRTYVKDESYNRGKRLICKTNKEDLLNVIIKNANIKDDDRVAHTFEEVFNEWNDKRLNNKQIKDSTYINIKAIFNRFFKNDLFCHTDISKIRIIDVQDFLEKVATITTRDIFSHTKSITRGTFVRAKKLGYVTFNISDIFDNLEANQKHLIPKETEDKKEVYTDREKILLFRYISEHKTLYNLGILLLFVSGLRIGELIALNKDDVDNYVIHVTKTLTKEYRNGHGYKHIGDSPKTISGKRYVPIPEKYHWIIDSIFELNQCSTLFLPSVKWKRIDPETMRSRLKSLCRKLQIDYKTIHAIRKTYITNMLDAGVNPKVVSTLVGHSNTIITEAVYHKDNKDLSEKIDIVNKAFINL